MSLNTYLGIDVGSVTTKLALVDEKGKSPEEHDHYNAGFLLINLKLWKEDDLEKKFIDYIDGSYCTDSYFYNDFRLIK